MAQTSPCLFFDVSIDFTNWVEEYHNHNGRDQMMQGGGAMVISP